MSQATVEKLLHLARQSIAERDWNRAKQAYLQALGYASDNPDVHYGLATVYVQTRELTSAAHHFRETTRLDPQRASAYINLGAVLKMMEQYDEAVAAIRKGLQIDPQRTEGYYNLGVIYRLTGKFDLAIQSYREAIKLNPRMADAHLNLANLYAERHNWRQAIDCYKEALKVKPEWDKALDGLAHAEAELEGKKPAEAPAQEQPRKKDQSREEKYRDKPLDPEKHGQYLLDLHNAGNEIEEIARQLMLVLERELEAALKALSTALLYRDTPRSQMDACVERFEKAMERVTAVQQVLAKKAQQIKEMGDKFPG